MADDNKIMDKSISIGLGLEDIDTIDKVNLRNATFIAMKKAIINLDIKPDRLLIDGVDIPKVKIPCEGIVKGDTKIESIMAASIIAKVVRDRIMIDFSVIYPEYGFEKHKGYGTKVHMEALKKYGPCTIHRKSLAPVKKYQKKEKQNRIKAKAILMPCSHDLYFPPEDNEFELKHMQNAELRKFDSIWGHCVANPGNDKNFEVALDNAINDLLK